jgi:hypothetical protein
MGREIGSKTHVNRDVDADAVVLLPGVALVVPFLGRVVAHHQGVLGELLEEALGACHVDVEVERPGHGGQGEERQQGPHRVGG